MVLCFFLLNYHNSKTNENMVKKKKDYQNIAPVKNYLKFL